MRKRNSRSKDGDTVVYLGDSITAARTYGKIIENYTLLRFPDRKMRFVNAGWGGDTAAGGLARLGRDVLDRQATVVIVAYGVNDIGWGVHADAQHKKVYLDAIRGIVEQCKKRKVRVFICSAAVTSADPAKSENSFLQKMCDEGMAIARDLGEHSIDVQRSMRAIQKRVWAFNASLKDNKGKVSLHAADGVHLTDLGQLAMAFAILKGLGAPATVSSATLDAAAAKVTASQGCRVTDFKAHNGTVEFTRLDEGRPINFGLFGTLQFRFIPIPQELNRYELKIKNLPVGKFDVRRRWPAARHIFEPATGRGAEHRFGDVRCMATRRALGCRGDDSLPLDQCANELSLSRLFTETYRQPRADRKQLVNQIDKANRTLEDLQRAVARPVPFRFVVAPALAKK